MMKALITGITGQDGAYLTELLLSKGYEVHGLMRRSSSFSTDRIEHVYDKIKLHYGDLTDASSLAKLVQTVGPDEVYNLGAQSHVGVSFQNPVYTVEADAVGTLKLLEAVRGTPAKFYQASSSEMFGKVAEVPQTEKTPFHPRSPYGCAKVYAYWQTVNYREAYNLFACNGILFNHECVTEETPVIIRKNGLVDIVPIGEVVPHRTNPKHGKKYTTIPAKPLEVWDQTGWTRVTCMTATYNDGNKEVIRVSTRSASFSATSDHVAFLADKSEIRVGDLKLGQRLCRATHKPAEVVTSMTEDEAWLLGALAGDGYVSETGSVRLTGNDITLLENAERIWRRLTGGKGHRYAGYSGFCDNVVHSTTMTGDRTYGKWLREQLYTAKRDKRVPRRILNADAAIRLAFLRGYNATDGLKHGRCNYEFQSFKSASPCLTAGLWWLAEVTLKQRTILCVEERGEHVYYQINLAIPESLNPGKRGRHLQRPLDEVLKVTKLSHTGWLFDLATESGTFHAGVGSGWIHNSPKRGETFVTRKITRAATRIKLGLQEKLLLGNLDAKRDWGFSGDYVEAMWLMLQQPKPDDYVIATGETHSVREFAVEVFSLLDLDWERYVFQDPRYIRPAEVDLLLGDASKAADVLGWKPKVPFKALAKMMTDADMRLARCERLLKDNGHTR